MRDEVVALEDETDRVIAVGVPVAVLVILRRAAVDDEVAVGVAVKAANDVQKRRLATTRRPQNGDKLVLAEFQGDAF